MEQKRGDEIAMLKEAVSKISALEYARRSGHPVYRTAQGWKSRELVGLTFTPDGGYRRGREHGGALRFVMLTEGLKREDAVLKLLETCRPDEASRLRLRGYAEASPCRTRMLPQERLDLARGAKLRGEEQKG